MLFNDNTKSHTDLSAEYHPVGWVFDWERNCFEMDTGTPVEADDEQAARYFLQLVLRTRIGRYAIYPADFGCRLQDIRGRKLRKGTALADLQSDLRNSAAYCDLIADISGVIYDGKNINIDVSLESGKNIVLEVAGND